MHELEPLLLHFGARTTTKEEVEEKEITSPISFDTPLDVASLLKEECSFLKHKRNARDAGYEYVCKIFA